MWPGFLITGKIQDEEGEQPLVDNLLADERISFF